MSDDDAAAKPRPPAELGQRGRDFWVATIAVWDLTGPELELLREVCRTLDEIEDLRAAVERDGATVAGSKGQVRAHPALSDIRASRGLVARLLAQLELPDERGDTLSTPLQARGRRAAASRWGRDRTRWGSDGATA